LQLHLKAITDLVIDMTILMLIRKGATEQQGTWEHMMDMDEVWAMEDMVIGVHMIMKTHSARKEKQIKMKHLEMKRKNQIFLEGFFYRD